MFKFKLKFILHTVYKKLNIHKTLHSNYNNLFQKRTLRN